MEKFRLNNSYESPENINYDILMLHKKRSIVKGELLSVEYYKNYNGVTYTELCVKENRIYTRNTIGLIVSRTLKIDWYNTDGSIGCSVTSPQPKYYDFQAQIQEGVNRRGNIISEAKIYAIEILGLPYSFDFLSSLKTPLDLYIQGYTQPLKDGVANSVKPYLNQTIKDTIINILTF